MLVFSVSSLQLKCSSLLGTYLIDICCEVVFTNVVHDRWYCLMIWLAAFLPVFFSSSHCIQTILVKCALINEKMTQYLWRCNNNNNKNMKNELYQVISLPSFFHHHWSCNSPSSSLRTISIAFCFVNLSTTLPGPSLVFQKRVQKRSFGNFPGSLLCLFRKKFLDLEKLFLNFLANRETLA